MKNQAFIDLLNRIIEKQFNGKVRKYALASNVKYQTLRNYLKRGSKPNPEILTKLARAAGMSISELYQEEPELPGMVNESFHPYEGLERRQNWLYTIEEQQYIDMLI